MSWRASIESDKQRARQDDLDFKAMIAIGLADSIKGQAAGGSERLSGRKREAIRQEEEGWPVNRV